VSSFLLVFQYLKIYILNSPLVFMIQNIRKPIGYHAIQTSSAKVLKATRELRTSPFPGHGSRLERFICVHVLFVHSNSPNNFEM